MARQPSRAACAHALSNPIARHRAPASKFVCRGRGCASYVCVEPPLAPASLLRPQAARMPERPITRAAPPQPPPQMHSSCWSPVSGRHPPAHGGACAHVPCCSPHSAYSDGCSQTSHIAQTPHIRRPTPDAPHIRRPTPVPEPCYSDGCPQTPHIRHRSRARTWIVHSASVHVPRTPFAYAMLSDGL